MVDKIERGARDEWPPPLVVDVLFWLFGVPLVAYIALDTAWGFLAWLLGAILGA